MVKKINSNSKKGINLKFNLNLSNKTAYTLIAIIFLFAVGGIVYAYNYAYPSGSSNPAVMGHTPDEIFKCGENETIKVVNGKWVCAVAGAGGGSCGFGDWVEITSDLEGVKGPVSSDGLVFVYTLYGGCPFTIVGYTDNNANPSTIRNVGKNVQDSGTYGPSMTMAVKKGDYWKVVKNGGCGSINKIYWLPLN